MKRLGNTRTTGKEQFYTPKAITDQIVKEAINLFGNTKVFLEPAGGTGNFIESAMDYGFKSIISFDIEPNHPKIIQADFLNTELDLQDALTICNPPFGRNNSLSIPFFNQAAKVSEIIVFIVPRSWRKWSVQNRLNLNFHLIKDQDLDLNYVNLNGDEISNKNYLKTCVQFWQKQSNQREVIKIKDYGFIKKSNPIEADVALTVFGFNCGKVERSFERIPNSTKIYLQVKSTEVIDLLEKIDYSRFSKNTAYIDALSIQEINYLLNEKMVA